MGLVDTARDVGAGRSGGGVGGADAGDNALRSAAACVPGGGIGTPNGKSRTSHWEGRRRRGRDGNSPWSDGRGRTRESVARADGDARVIAAVKGLSKEFFVDRLANREDGNRRYVPLCRQ
jgi:hypothetical protein